MSELAKVDLVRDEIPTGAQRVTRLPGWFQSTPGRYVHRPRSAYLFASDAGYRRSGMTVNSWCGPFRRITRSTLWWDHEPTQDEHDGLGVCASCTGRAEAWLGERPELVHGPRDWFGLDRRVWCPGGQSYGHKLYIEFPGHRSRALCLLCGHDGKTTAHGGPWYSSIKMVSHHPAGPPLAACTFHGWRHLRLASIDGNEPATHLACSSHQCTWSAPIPAEAIAWAAA